MSKESEALPAPEGTLPFLLTMKQMDKLGLKTGARLSDVVPYAWIPMQQIQEDLSFAGSLSPWAPVQKELQKYPGEAVLLVSDPELKYGNEGWLVCLTPEAADAALAPMREAEAAAAAKAAAEAEAAAAAAEAEAAAAAYAASVVVRDSPVPARPYVSATAEASAKEVVHAADGAATAGRPKLRIQIRRRRREFGRRVGMNIREGGEPMVEIRSRKDGNFDTRPLERNLSFQVGAGCLSGSTAVAVQTSWQRPLPRAVQTSAVDAASHGVPASGSRGEVELQGELSSFLQRVLNGTEYALSQNETLDIFKDELARLKREEVGGMVGGAGDVTLVERRMYMSLALSNRRALQCVAWHPTINQWVAVAVAPRLSLTAAAARAGRPRTHHILVFTTKEFASQIALVSPHPVTVFAWNPSQPALLAAGCATGHVMLYDLQPAFDARSHRRRGSSGGGGGKDGTPPLARGEGGIQVHPRDISVPEASHSGPVVSLAWVPAPQQVLQRGRGFGPAPDGKCWQFITAGQGGGIAVWDTRYAEQALSRPGARRAGGSQRDVGDVVGGAPAAELVAATPTTVPWTPVYRTRLHGGGGACNFTALQFDLHNLARPVYGTTETGQVVCAEWAPAGHAEGSVLALGAAAEGEGEGGGPRVLWLSPGTHRPGTAVLRSPFFEDVLLVVQQSSFALWRVGLQVPVWESPACPAHITSAAWSPTRPGVVYLGRADGAVDVWDLADTTLHPATTATGIATEAVTCLHFRMRYAGDGVVAPRCPPLALSAGDSTSSTGTTSLPAGAPRPYGTHFLAVGDAKGQLHVLEVPAALHVAGSAEERVVRGWLTRESDRVAYYAKRWAVRAEEAAAAERAAAEAAAAAASAAAAKDSELSALRTALAQELSLGGGEEVSVSVLEDIAAKRAGEAAEGEFQKLQAQLLEELELDPAEYWAGQTMPPALRGAQQ